MISVLVACRSVSDKPERLPPIMGVRVTYLQKLYAQALLPLFVAPGMNAEMVDELYSRSAGILLTGGEDVNPLFYGEEPHSTTSCDTYGRDELEITLAKTALTDKKPILGICRGCQVLAVAAGGSLYQHIPDIRQDEIHDNGEAMLANALRHPVRLLKDSKIALIVGRSQISVNSYHHQCVSNPGEEIIASGHSQSGLIECIEHRDKRYFCIGVQSHPENENGDLENVFSEFAVACKNQASLL